MSIPSDLTSREMTKFVESNTMSGQPCIVVSNADGTSVGYATEQISQTQGDAYNQNLPSIIPTTVRADTPIAYASDTRIQPLISNGDGALYVVEAPVAGNTNSLSYSTSSAIEESRVVKASAGRLYEVDFANTNAAPRYFQIFNSATLPADNAIPFFSFAVAANGSFSRSWPHGVYFSAGICVCNSEVDYRKILGSADSLFQIGYK